VTESSTLYALLHFGTGTHQPSTFLFPKCFVCGLAFPSDSVSGVWESLPADLLFGGLELLHI